MITVWTIRGTEPESDRTCARCKDLLTTGMVAFPTDEEPGVICSPCWYEYVRDHPALRVVPPPVPSPDAQPVIPLAHQMTEEERQGDFWAIWKKWNEKHPLIL